MKRKIFSIIFVLTLTLTLTLVPATPAAANDVDSSTMEFEGSLTDQGDGVYTGTIPMTAGSYYVSGGPGESISDTGGFDVYALAGGTAYVEGMTPDSWTIGSDHDAYSETGPWGSWYDPDCEDWDKYTLELTEDHWYLRYTSTGESPMSGEMDWNAMYAAETDPGTNQNVGDITDPTKYGAGSAQEWGWRCGWGQERIPLQYLGFDVSVTDEGGGVYHVTLAPAEAPSSMSLSADIVADIIAISVNPTTIDFGILRPGETSDITSVTVRNTGTVTVDVDASVNPILTVFDNLEVGAQVVPTTDLILGLAVGAHTAVDAQLPVPSGYTPAGEETATLVFEASTP